MMEYPRLIKESVDHEVKKLRHMAIVLDGNRRYGKQILGNSSLAAHYGHLMGTANTIELASWFINSTDVETLSLFVLAIKNLERDPEEVQELKRVIGITLDMLSETRELKEKGVRIIVAGKREVLEQELQEKIARVERETQEGNKKRIYLCIAYDSEDEMKRAAERAKEAGKDLSIKFFDVPEEVDLFIRPAERRMSGFLNFQAAQAEVIFCDLPFPAMTPTYWKACVLEYYHRKRNLGK